MANQDNMTAAADCLVLDNQSFNCRLLLGTAQYDSPRQLKEAVIQSDVEIITTSLRRQARSEKNEFWQYIRDLKVKLLPNTAGCHSAKEAITTAQMARELFDTHWIKLEVIGDDYSLQPDPFALLEATKELQQQGFFVLPYCTDDLVVATKLLEAGCQAIMPWAAPIGSGQGIVNASSLARLRNRFPGIPMIVDAGIGRPSDAVVALEMGFDAVLINSAVALAQDPPKMAVAFSQAVAAGRQAFAAGIMPKTTFAQASTPLLDTPFWQQNS